MPKTCLLLILFQNYLKVNDNKSKVYVARRSECDVYGRVIAVLAML